MRHRRTFTPLEDLRNRIHPIRVLHEAVHLAGVADTGPMLPFLEALSEADRALVRAETVRLMGFDG